ncbi:MAG: hypothetical protein N0E59_20915 [Candidatus Thiodiazotropha taylori]|nr:hypothetical protein [Candidatus Thiodiazotropha taylori]
MNESLDLSPALFSQPTLGGSLRRFPFPLVARPLEPADDCQV